jgi:chromate reductase
MAQLVGIAGSLRKDSFNRKLLVAASEQMPTGSTLEVLSIDDVPLYNADVEEQTGIPAAVAALKDKVAEADGLVLVTPE